MAAAVQVEANLKEQLSNYLHFQQDRTYGEMQDDSVFEFFINELRLTSSFGVDQES